MPRLAEAVQTERRWRQAAADLWTLGSDACNGIPNAHTPAVTAWNRDRRRSAANGWRCSSARNRSRWRALADHERCARLQTGQGPAPASAAATDAISDPSSPCLVSRLGRWRHQPVIFQEIVL